MNKDFYLFKPKDFYHKWQDIGDVFKRATGVLERIDQKYFYWDRLGAYNWLQLSDRGAEKEYPLGDEARTILVNHIDDIINKVLGASDSDSIDLISLGVGNGRDDNLIIDRINKKNKKNIIHFFAYDISIDLICHSLIRIKKRHINLLGSNRLILHAINDDFDNLPSFQKIFNRGENIKLFHFLGSTISNFDEHYIIDKISSVLGHNDYLLIGVDCGHDNIFTESKDKINNFIEKNSSSQLGYKFLLGPIKSFIAMHSCEDDCLESFKLIMPHIHDIANDKIEIYGKESSSNISRINNTLTMQYRIGLENQNDKDKEDDDNKDPVLNISHKYCLESFLKYMISEKKFNIIAEYAPEIIKSKTTRYCLILLQKTDMNEIERKKSELIRLIEKKIYNELHAEDYAEELNTDQLDEANNIKLGEYRNQIEIEVLEKWLRPETPLVTIIQGYKSIKEKKEEQIRRK